MRTCFVRAMPVPRRYRGRYRSANFVAAEGETAFLHFSRRSDRCGSVTQKRETSRGSAKRVVCFLSLPPSHPSRYSLAVQRVIASYRAATLGQALRSMNGTERRETRKKRVDAQLLTRSVIGSASDAQRNTVSLSLSLPFSLSRVSSRRASINSNERPSGHVSRLRRSLKKVSARISCGTLADTNPRRGLITWIVIERRARILAAGSASRGTSGESQCVVPSAALMLLAAVSSCSRVSATCMLRVIDTAMYAEAHL